MRGILKYLLLLCVALSMGSCASSMQDKVTIDGYENLQVLGFSGVKTDLIFSNDSAHNVDLRSVTLLLKENGSSLATLTLKDEIEIPRRSEGVSIPTIWSLSNVNILTALSASKRILEGGDISNIKVDVQFQVKVSVIKKNYEFKDRSLSSLIKSL